VDGYFTGLQKELNDLAARFPERGSSGLRGRTDGTS
jgi:hypothetical protein